MPSEQAQKFLDWISTELSGDNALRARTIIGRNAESREGRELIARSYVEPARQRLQRALRGHQEARRLCLTLEGLLNLFPAEERFSTTLITLREILIELYSSLSTNYEVIIRESKLDPYQGPRPTRFERLLEHEDEKEPEEPPQQAPVDPVSDELGTLFHQKLGKVPVQRVATIHCHYCGKEKSVPVFLHNSRQWISDLPPGWITSNTYRGGFRFSCSTTCAQNESYEGLKSLGHKKD